MQFPLQTFQQLLQRMSAAVQGSTAKVLDLSQGSMLRALLEANASIGLWIQWLIVQTLSTTRAATSSDADLDSWMADFALERQAAIAAQGLVTFSRLSATTTAFIPQRASVKTQDGSSIFNVISDPAHSAWNVKMAGYQMPIGVASIDVPVIAGHLGILDNLSAGTITTISTSMPGVDIVINNDAMAGGADAESDDRLRVRFRDYINSRSQGTAAAVAYAITSIQQSMRYKLFENTNINGVWKPGCFLVVVDDGTGQPLTALLNQVRDSINKIRPLGIEFAVRPPDVIPVNIDITLSSSANGGDTSKISMAKDAVSSFVGTLPIGAALSITRVVQAFYSAAEIDQNILSLHINGASADLTPPPYGILKAQIVTVH